MMDWIILGALLTLATFLSFKLIPGLKTKRNAKTLGVALVLAAVNSAGWWITRGHLPSLLSTGLVLWLIDVVLMFLSGKVVPGFLEDSGTAPLAGAFAIAFFGGLFVALMFG